MRKIFTKFNLVVAIFLMSLVIAMPVAHAETFSLTYDNNGNLIDGQYFSYVYNEFNQLVEVYDSLGNLIEEYAYDYEGNRVKKVEHFFDGTSETTYYPFPEQVRKVDANGTEDTYYYFLDGETIARDDPDGSRKYYHNDHLGSHTVVTDDNGAVVEETEYLPYGKVLSGGDTDFLYNGKEQDSTNLLYYGARYYDAEMRQFTQPDTIIADYYDPQNLNRYSYVLNNPYKYVDPDGHIPVALMGLAVGATYLAAITSPYWMPYIGAYFTNQDINDVQTAVQEPSAGNVAWAGIALVPAVTELKTGAKLAKSGTEVASKIPINKLRGHETTDATHLFREGAKSHVNKPIDAIRIGDEYLINDGVGRSMRALKEGDSFVNANIVAEYSDVEHLKTAASEGYGVAKRDLFFWERSTKIVDAKRWDNLK
ncbi:MAG: RHS repeat-associated core domain-containing protein [archaeon]|nr:hypothetical protein [Nanoarchaeota archaeon]